VGKLNSKAIYPMIYFKFTGGIHMTSGGTFVFDTSTLLVVVVCLILAGIIVSIVIQARILEAISSISIKEKAQENIVVPQQTVQRSAIPSTEKQQVKGEVKLVGVEDEELVAAIMVAVSNASNIPLSSLKIRSIKRVSE
jgi:cytoskeletal protein RodZ